MKAFRGVALLLPWALAVGCQRTPKCSGEPDQDDLYRMEQLIHDGKEPCPEHLKPKIVLDSKGLSLNDELVARPDALVFARHTRVRPLFERLKQNRETWKMTHPGKSFDAEPSLVISGDAEAIVGASIVTTTAYAGYPDQRLSVAGIAFDLAYDVPGPPSLEADFPPIELKLDRTADGTYQVRYARGSVVLVAADAPLGFESVPGWAAEHCPVSPGRCATAIVLTPSGPFVAAVTLLKNVLDRFPPARRPLTIKFFDA